MSDHEKSGFREGLDGVVEGVKGKAKEVAGAVVGDDDLRGEGRAQQDKAEAQREAAQKEAQAKKARVAAELDEQRQRSHQNR
ncbi:microaggregate-binding protein 1 [Nocardia tengchongensis]|uniref:microaggregate-binding protein 1 n=1 Tax=Nocardia tengchongensis TaxID=2055889 RepID=UPI00364DBCE4